jgi:hypothetical protein
VLRKIGRAEAREHLGQADRWHALALLIGTEQIERRSGAGQARAGQMEVAHRRAHMAVTEQTLDGVDVDPGFEQMRGERMAPMSPKT